MPQVVPDFSEAVEAAPIPDGVYSARVIGSEIKTSRAGNDYVKWKLQVFGAEGDLTPINNRVVYHNTMLAGPGSGILKSFQKAIVGRVIEAGFDTDEFLGKEAQVTLVTTLDDNGEKRLWPEVKAVKALH